MAARGVRDIFLRVFDANGALVYQSTSLQDRITTRPPDVELGQIAFRTVSGADDENVRVAATAIDVQNHRYMLELVQAVTVGERSLARFGRMLMLVVPLALVVASLGGYWLSGRALATVTQISADAPESTRRICLRAWQSRPHTMNSVSCRKR
jgi:hypothetical protein